MTAAQIVLIVFIALLLIAYPILISRRNKKERTKLTEQTNSLKRGDKVLTTSGIYGTIVDLHLDGEKQIITIETGTGKNKGYLSIDAYAVYTVFKEEEKTEAKDEKSSQKDEKSKEAQVKDEKISLKEEKPAEKDEKSKVGKKDDEVKKIEDQIHGKK